MFKVQKRMCSTCIYRPDSPLDIKKLERDVADPFMEGMFRGHRICHHSKDVCCRGFWERHKDSFPAGQIAQRLNVVEFVEVDNREKSMFRKEPKMHEAHNTIGISHGVGDFSEATMRAAGTLLVPAKVCRPSKPAVNCVPFATRTMQPAVADDASTVLDIPEFLKRRPRGRK